MNKNTGIAILALTAMTTSLAAPIAVRADDSAKTQKQKNDWRNLAIGAGVIAGHGLINHNTTETLIGAAGAAYSAKKYEDARKKQSQDNAYRARYHRRSGTYTTGNRKYYTYGGNRYYMDLTTGQRFKL
jgi:hypothetical protein